MVVQAAQTPLSYKNYLMFGKRFPTKILPAIGPAESVDRKIVGPTKKRVEIVIGLWIPHHFQNVWN